MKKKIKTKPDKSRPEAALKETTVPYRNRGKTGTGEAVEDQGWIDFRDQCRRQMQRPLELRIRYGFSRPIKPAPNQMRWRAFATMADYRAWCEKNLPDYLGFKRPAK
jgi:hypothetical protein